MTGVESDLAALRRAAHERDHDQLQYVLKRLVMQLPFYHALAIAVERAHGYVAIFERDYPDAKWARQVLTYIATVGKTPGELPPEALHDYPAPGSGNFVKAVFDLGNAAYQEHQMEARIGYVVSAIVNTVMAELVAAWYGGRLDEWERVRQNQIDPTTGQYSDPEATYIALRFWTDEAIAQRDTESWLAIAEQVERHLART